MSGGAIAWDYVVVGSGAGGGTVAARLVESGKRVFVIEAGRDGRSQLAPALPDDYDVPGFHALACENHTLKWDYTVKHYSDPARQRRDWKYNRDLGGILYPRAATLGGCTAHNAMIFMLPHDADWDGIATLTGDPSWSARHMRKYLRGLESCQYRPLWRRLQRLGIDPSGHGWLGWLRTEMPQVLEALDDGQLRRFILDTACTFLTAMRHPLRAVPRWVLRFADPNSRQGGSAPFEGLCNPPLATANHVRVGARERLLQAQARYPDRLHIEPDALATRVLFAPDGAASGVEFLKGKALFSRSHLAGAERRAVYARGEVILSAGAFNTPQLLMLSGIGPETELLEHNIKVRVPLAGVGKNLQDRYEVAVTHRMGRQWSLLREANFERGDPLWREWTERRNGLYSSNGTVLAFVRRSEGEPLPDIFCMGLPVRFEGYYPGFSRKLVDNRDCLTWAVLKAHTRNRAGEVTLRSRDPRVPPQIHFKYFDEGSDSEGRDLQQMVEAIQFVRRLTAPLIHSGLIGEERVPGPQVSSPEGLSEYVRDTAWGHHASCSCAMGAREHGGVIDSRFKVHGVERLRVVDASVFPRIPGFFIVSAVYLVAEKAADVILDAAHSRAATHSIQQRKETDMTITVTDLLHMPQQKLDDLFKAAPAGDIPNGPADGTAIIAPDTRFSQPIATMINMFGWQGKVFDAQTGLLKNRILPMGIEAIVARVYKAPSWLDGKECIVLDYSETSTVAHWIRDEIRLIQPNFYLGKVYWAKERLIDFCLQFNP